MSIFVLNMFRRVVYSALVLLASHILMGQSTLTSVGRPTGSAVYPIEHGFVDLSNGNVHIEIPIEGYKQRGDVSVPAAFVYDSNIWSLAINTSTGKGQWYPYNVLDFYGLLSAGGWRFNYMPAAVGGSFSDGPTFSCTLPNGSQVYLSPTESFYWNDSSGTYHYFAIQTVDIKDYGCTNSVPYQDTSAGTAYATDGSGYYASVTNYAELNVWAPNGTQVLSSSSGSSNAVQIDRNGNCLGCLVQGDTLGRSPINGSVGQRDSNGNVVVEYYDVTTTNGVTARYTIKYETLNLKTDFGASNATEFTGTMQAVESIGLPDGTSYQFSYENGTYGELNGITLPHGGTVGLQYSSSSASGTTMPARWANQHTGSDGTTNFALSVQTNAFTNPTTNNPCNVYTDQVTTDQATNSANQVIYPGSAIVYKFQNCGEGSYDYSETYYTDPNHIDNTHIVSITTKSYDYTNKCPNRGCSSYYVTGTTTKEPQLSQWVNVNNISQQIWDPVYSWITAQINYQYNGTAGSGLPTYVKQSDFPTSGTYYSTGGQSREVDTAYGYNVNGALFPTSRTFKGSTGSAVSEIAYAYDQPNSTIICKPGEPQHLVAAPNSTPNLMAVSGPRGNLSSITVTDPATGASRITCYYYDTAGEIQAEIDPNGNLSTFGYDSTDTFQTQTTAPTTDNVSHETNKTYDFNTGQVTSYTDQNNQKTTNTYDSLGRLQSVVFSTAGNKITLKTFSYPSANETDEVDQQSPTAASVKQIFVDGYGRTVQTIRDGISQETTYDAHGLKYSVTNPHIVGTPSATDGVSYWTHDAVGRVISSTNAAGQTTTIAYNGIARDITDPLGNQTAQIYDTFGDLVEVFENYGMVNYGDGNLQINGWNTYYTYNGLGKTVQIDQWGDYSSPDRVRKFTYDGFGELTSQNTPEAGTLTITYDNNGNVTSRTNQNSGYNSTHYQYDALNRVVSKTFWNGTTQLTAPSYSYTYDAQDGSGDLYGNGLLTGTSNGSNVQTLSTHDAMGRVTSTKYCLPSDCSFDYEVSAKYDYDGNMTSLTYPDGRQVSWAYNTLNLPINAIFAQWNGSEVGTPYISNVAYTPTGKIQQAIFGNGTREGATYDPNQNIISLAYLGPNGAPITEKTYTWAQNGANLLTVNDLAVARSQSYSYDSLNRISGMTDTGAPANACSSGLPGIPQASETYSIDAWGNLTQSGNWSFQQIIGSNNQISAGQGYYYDSAGNVTQDSNNNAYQYRPDGLMSSSDGVTYTYDALDQRIRKDGASSNEYFYFGGQLLAMRNTGTDAWTDRIYGPSGAFIAVPSTPQSGSNPPVSGAPIYRITDHLGSVNFTLDASGNVLGVASALPFGQLTVNSTSDNFIFTDHELDSENGSYYALYRNFSPVQGRWLSPDPYNGSYTATDPQTLNRYAYLANRPMNGTDPQGLCDDDDWLCDLGGGWSGLLDALESGMDQAADAFQSSTGLSIPDYWFPSTQTLLGSNSDDEAPSENGSGTIDAQNEFLGAATAAGNLPGVGAVFNTALAGYYTYEGDYGTAAAFGGAAIASAVGLPGGSEVADGLEAAGEAEAVAEPAIEAADEATAEANQPLLAAGEGVNPWAGNVTSSVLESDTTMYRVWGDEADQVGAWLSPTPPASQLSAIEDLALPPGNSAQWLSEVNVPAGTRIQTGFAAGAFGMPGGAAQVLLLDRIPVANFGPGVYIGLP